MAVEGNWMKELLIVMLRYNPACNIVECVRVQNRLTRGIALSQRSYLHLLLEQFRCTHSPSPHYEKYFVVSKLNQSPFQPERIPDNPPVEIGKSVDLLWVGRSLPVGYTFYFRARG